MNAFAKRSLAVLGLLLSMSLTSCQNPAVVEPVRPGSPDPPVQQPVVPTDGTFYNPATKPVLVQHGQHKLTYYPNGKLKRVDFNTTDWYKELTYQPGLVTSKMYADNKLVETIISHLNADGLSVLDEFFNLNGKLSGSLVYDYYPDGRMKKAYFADKPSVRREFYYNLIGDLTKELSYSEYGSGFDQETHYYYTQAGLPLIEDKYPIIRDGQEGIEYNDIYGKPSPHLIRRIIQMDPVSKKVNTVYDYQYQLNAQGFVTVQDEYNQIGTKQFSRVYLYQ